MRLRTLLKKAAGITILVLLISAPLVKVSLDSGVWWAGLEVLSWVVITIVLIILGVLLIVT